MIEYKLYITNPMFYGSSQNNFEKNLSGKITINEVVLDNGLVERTATGEVSGVPVPFTNPQTNLVVADNTGTITKHGEPSLFSPPKVLANEMLAIIRDEFAVKYGLNIDFSLDPPKEVVTTTTNTGVTTQAPGAVMSSATAVGETPVTTTATATASTVATASTPAAPGSPSGFSFNFDKDKALKIAAVAGGAALVGAGAYALIKNSKDKKPEGTASKPEEVAPKTDTKPAVAPIEDNKIKGIKILVPSQYLDVYEISKYGGAPALLTNKDSKQMVWLDKDYDRPEFLPSNLTSPLKVNDDGTGDFKIGIHLGYPGGKKVGNWSEDGSQVFSTADELNDFFKLCDAHKEKYGNKLSYTLSTRDDWDEAQKSVQTNKAVPDPGTASTPPAVEEKIAGTPSTPQAEVEDVVLTAFKNLNFDTNKADIRTESFESLDKLAELLKKESSWKLKIEGHTDSVGSPQSNADLSTRRAFAAKKYLVDKGVPEAMITTAGLGETTPLADNKTEEGRQKNRRVVLIITKPDKTTIAAGTTLSETAVTTNPVT
jgi:outer membrane protein OmpA-like peptidoglycan-associated protein